MTIEQRIMAAAKKGKGLRLSAEDVAEMADWLDVIEGAQADDAADCLESEGRSEWHHWDSESASTRGEQT